MWATVKRPPAACELGWVGSYSRGGAQPSGRHFVVGARRNSAPGHGWQLPARFVTDAMQYLLAACLALAERSATGMLLQEVCAARRVPQPRSLPQSAPACAAASEPAEKAGARARQPTRCTRILSRRAGRGGHGQHRQRDLPQGARGGRGRGRHGLAHAQQAHRVLPGLRDQLLHARARAARPMALLHRAHVQHRDSLRSWLRAARLGVSVCNIVCVQPKRVGYMYLGASSWMCGRLQRHTACGRHVESCLLGACLAGRLPAPAVVCTHVMQACMLPPCTERTSCAGTTARYPCWS